MNRRDMTALLPVMQGLVALRDMIDSKDFKVAVDELSKADKAMKAATKAANEATKEREVATREMEQRRAAMVDEAAAIGAQKAEYEALKAQVENDSRAFEEHREIETARLQSWEERLNAIPDVTEKLERKLAAADKKLAKAEALEEQYTARLIELGLQPAA